MNWLEYYLFRRVVDGLDVPRFLRRVFAGSAVHRCFMLGRLYGWGCLWRWHEAPYVDFYLGFEDLSQ
jgi:hypothetical protein